MFFERGITFLLKKLNKGGHPEKEKRIKGNFPSKLTNLEEFNLWKKKGNVILFITLLRLYSFSFSGLY